MQIAKYRGILKPRHGMLALLCFSSYNFEHKLLSHEILPISSGYNNRSKKPSKEKAIKIYFKKNVGKGNHYRPRRSGFRNGFTAPRVIQRLAVQGSVLLAEIMREIQTKLFDESNVCLIAAQLHRHNQEKEKWLNPQIINFLEEIKKLRETERMLVHMKNNGATESQVKFFEDLRRIREGSIRLEMFRLSKMDDKAISILESEIQNFSEPFEIWI